MDMKIFGVILIVFASVNIIMSELHTPLSQIAAWVLGVFIVCELIREYTERKL